MSNIKHRELMNCSKNININYNKFYTKEFNSDNGVTYYIHYFNDEMETTIHNSFVYNNSIDRENDFNNIKEKLVYNK